MRGAVLHVPPFADEQNLSRRMSSLQAKSFAAAGYAVLQVDLFGCGDSEGDFAAATWAGWLQDVVAAEGWLRTEAGYAPVWWGVRTGCLLAVQAAGLMERPAQFLFWQPVMSGAVHWRQFQRIGQAGEMMAGEPAPQGLPGAVEIAGYSVSSALRESLTAARLDLPATTLCAGCLETGSGEGPVTPALGAAVDAWRREGRRVDVVSVAGPPFWQVPEAPDCPALITATDEMLASLVQLA